MENPAESLVIPVRAEHIRLDLFLLEHLNSGIRHFIQFSENVDQDKLLSWISDEYTLLIWYEDEDLFIMPFDEFRYDKLKAGGDDPLRWFECCICQNWMALGQSSCPHCGGFAYTESKETEHD